MQAVALEKVSEAPEETPQNGWKPFEEAKAEGA